MAQPQYQGGVNYGERKKASVKVPPLKHADGANMFVGHYGVAFAAKPIETRVPLWVWFIAVQWLDVVWSILVLVGIESLTASVSPQPMRSISITCPTHIVCPDRLCSLILGGIVALFTNANRWVTILLVVAASFSHWLLDLVVHTPDLPLYDNAAKVGFGLWRHVALSFPLELIVLGLGAWLYARMTRFCECQRAVSVLGLHNLTSDFSDLRELRSTSFFACGDGSHRASFLCGAGPVGGMGRANRDYLDIREIRALEVPPLAREVLTMKAVRAIGLDIAKSIFTSRHRTRVKIDVSERPSLRAPLAWVYFLPQADALQSPRNGLLLLTRDCRWGRQLGPGLIAILVGRRHFSAKSQA